MKKEKNWTALDLRKLRTQLSVWHKADILWIFVELTKQYQVDEYITFLEKACVSFLSYNTDLCFNDNWKLSILEESEFLSVEKSCPQSLSNHHQWLHVCLYACTHVCMCVREHVQTRR